MRGWASVSADFLATVRQREDGVAVAPRKHLGRGLLERQPAVARCSPGATRIGVSRGTSSEKTCSVFFGDARCVATREDFVGVGLLPVLSCAARRRYRFPRRLPRTAVSISASSPFAAAGDGLPVAGVGGAFEEEDLMVRAVDDDQHRDRLLCGPCQPLPAASVGRGQAVRPHIVEDPERDLLLLPVFDDAGQHVVEGVEGPASVGACSSSAPLMSRT